jgi:hypothetical protein
LLLSAYQEKRSNHSCRRRNNNNIAEATKKIRPMGQNSMKRKLEEDKILASISKKIESTTTSISAQLLAALLQIQQLLDQLLHLGICNWPCQIAPLTFRDSTTVL